MNPSRARDNPGETPLPEVRFPGSARESGGSCTFSLKGISEDNLSPRGTFLFRSRIKLQWHRFITCFVGTLLVPCDGRWKERPCPCTRALRIYVHFPPPFTCTHIHIQNAARKRMYVPRTQLSKIPQHLQRCTLERA